MWDHLWAEPVSSSTLVTPLSIKQIYTIQYNTIVLIIQESIEKRFFVNCVQIIPGYENTSEDMER